MKKTKLKVGDLVKLDMSITAAVGDIVPANTPMLVLEYKSSEPGSLPDVVALSPSGKRVFLFGGLLEKVN